MNRIVSAADTTTDISNTGSSPHLTPSPNGTAGSGHHRPAWTEAAPASVASASAWDEPNAGWRHWLFHLEQRSSPPPFKKLFPCKGSVLAWGLAGGDGPTEAVALDSLLRKRLKFPSPASLNDTVISWLADAAQPGHGTRYAFDALAWAYRLPEVASAMTPAAWWSLVEHLAHAAQQAQAEPNDRQPLAAQLLSAELPLVLAARLPELARCQMLAATGMAALQNGIEELVTAAGLPHAEQLSSLRLLLACWTRSLRIAEGPISAEADGNLKTVRTRLGACLHAALCLARRDGTQLLGQEELDLHSVQLFEAAAKVTGDKAARLLTRRLIDHEAKDKSPKKPNVVLPSVSRQCDMAEAAVLRTDWSRSATSLAVRHDTHEIQFELHVAGASLWKGVWPLEVAADGRRCRVKSAWENVCWVCDDDAVYLELQATLSGGVRVQRQMMLARQEGFLFLADAVISDDALHLDYSSRIPLTRGTTCQPADDTRELRLQFGKRTATVLPLALPEWRQDPRGGVLGMSEGSLEVAQSRPARRLYAPLWIDLDKRRRGKPLTWRQLTVAENRQGQPAEVAVGYRVQIGRQQWLIYRSLAERANRTLLGSNLVSEFMVARFTAQGEADPLLEIE